MSGCELLWDLVLSLKKRLFVYLTATVYKLNNKDLQTKN